VLEAAWSWNEPSTDTPQRIAASLHMYTRVFRSQLAAVLRKYRGADCYSGWRRDACSGSPFLEHPLAEVYV
jgi:hypothetical protein